jgi:hypothetical protein
MFAIGYFCSAVPMGAFGHHHGVNAEDALFPSAMNTFLSY